MISSFCIKNNHTNIINFLLEDLENFSSNYIIISNSEFKIFKNVIVHCRKKNFNEALDLLCLSLFRTIIKFYEDRLLKMILKENYFYFSYEEQSKILKLATINLNEDILNYETKKLIMIKELKKYLYNHKNIVLEGLVFFRLPEYMNFLDCVLASTINEFIIEKEYNEFINLLKVYISTTKSSVECVHLIYNKNMCFLLDKNLNYIENDEEMFKLKYLSDISFSDNDYTLNSLLNLLPQKIHLHLLSDEDEFIKTLKKIFNQKISICTNCNICRLYNQKKI